MNFLKEILKKIKIKRMIKHSISLDEKIRRIEANYTNIRLSLGTISKQINNLQKSVDELKKRGR